MVAAAALEERWTVEEIFKCNGAISLLMKFLYHVGKRRTWFSIFAEAFANSCNPTFIEIGLKLNKDKLNKYVEKFHLTDETINELVRG